MLNTALYDTAKRFNVNLMELGPEVSVDMKLTNSMMCTEHAIVVGVFDCPIMEVCVFYHELAHHTYEQFGACTYSEERETWRRAFTMLRSDNIKIPYSKLKECVYLLKGYLNEQQPTDTLVCFQA